VALKLPLGYFPPLALFLPITAVLLHSILYDSLLYPQVSWFFHLLLGLIPLRPGRGLGEPYSIPMQDERHG
jgi:predicted membrane metal-binding protein